jgi:hypothetical protein
MKKSLTYGFVPCLAGFASVFAQERMDVRSQSQWAPPSAVNKVATAESDLAPAEAPPARPESPFNWRGVTLRPHLDFTVMYGDGIQNRPGAREKTVTEVIAPGMLIELGRNWALDYTPRLTYYSSDAFKDTLGHNASLRGGVKYENWKFGLIQSYSLTEDPLIETGTQTEQEVFGTHLTASHPLGSKMLLELGVHQYFRFAEGLNDSRSWSTLNWLNYQFAPKLSVAAGVGGGYDRVSPGPDMTFEQIQSRLNWRIAQKLNLAVNGGVEIRQIKSTGADDLVNPIYGASIQYRPFDYTTLTLAGDRRVHPALSSGTVTEETEISIAVNQRLLGMLFLTVSGGYVTTDYVSSFGGTPTVRSDDRKQVMVSLAYSFLKRASASVFYQASDHESNVVGYSYGSTQVGLNLAYRF